ncbi:MAG: dihydroorotate dehydrogenase electron transfer subunit [Ruminococcaceae bacterium]|nr:dihydroorotate dehydrogenase electron transfer subunit [Oscillospiraceae bacterium]
MEQRVLKVNENIQLTDSIYKMILCGDVSAIKNSGEFINIEIPELFLRRPISVCDFDEKSVTIIYKVVGKGTEKLAEAKVGDSFDVLLGLGNGYNTATTKVGDRVLLLGGGVGVPPLYNLAKRLIGEGKAVTVVLGFNTASEIFYEKEFAALGAEVRVTTVDGSYGIKGFVTDAISDVDYAYFYTCGPEPMLKAVYRSTKTEGQFSFESRMGCGFGACMGCSCKTNFGNKRICKDGPVFLKEEILW